MSSGKKGARPDGSKQPPDTTDDQGTPSRPFSLPLGYYEYYGISLPKGAVQAKRSLYPGRPIPLGYLEHYGIVQRKPDPAAQDQPDKIEQQYFRHELGLKDTIGQIAALEGELTATRKLALDRKLIAPAAFRASLGLSRAMMALWPAVHARQPVDSRMQHEAAHSASTLYASLREMTSDEKNFEIQPAQAGEMGSTVAHSHNPYTQQWRTDIFPLKARITEGPLFGLSHEIEADDWENAYAHYRQLLQGFDAWIAKQLQTQLPAESAEAQRGQLLGHQNALRFSLDAIADKNPRLLPALFYPSEEQQKKERPGDRVIQHVPMHVYYWQEGSKWHLRDLTAPSQPHDEPLDQAPTSALLGRFFEEVCRYPAGKVRFQIPGGPSGETVTTGKIKWYEWLGYVGLGAGLVGLALLSGGLSVPATVAFAGGALATGVSAAGHLHDQAQLGTLTTTMVVVDVAQIVSACAGAGLAARTVSVAVGASSAANLANRTFVILAGTAASADVVQFGALTADSMEQIKRIEQGGGSPADKQRAVSVLLAQLIVTGGLAVLSVKGARDARSMIGRNLELVEDSGRLKLQVEEGAAVPTSRGTSERGNEKNTRLEYQSRGGDRELPPGSRTVTESSNAAEVARPRQERLAELSRDHIDHGGKATDGTRREAEVALGLEERGEVPAPVRRPNRGDGHSGDFVDGKEQDWDVKAERSRDKLIEEIKARMRAAGKPAPHIDPNKNVKGEFNLDEFLKVIEREFATKEGVMIDTRGLNANDLKTLKTALAEKAKVDPRYKDMVRLYP